MQGIDILSALRFTRAWNMDPGFHTQFVIIFVVFLSLATIIMVSCESLVFWGVYTKRLWNMHQLQTCCFLCPLAARPCRPRYFYSSPFGALWKHSHDHLAWHCLCVQRPAHGKFLLRLSWRKLITCILPTQPCYGLANALVALHARTYIHGLVQISQNPTYRTWDWEWQYYSRSSFSWRPYWSAPLIYDGHPEIWAVVVIIRGMTPNSVTFFHEIIAMQWKPRTFGVCSGLHEGKTIAKAEVVSNFRLSLTGAVQICTLCDGNQAAV